MKTNPCSLTRRTLLSGAAGLALLPAMGASGARSAAARQPNIVFIMADDLGYADIGCFGARDILTPHIDSLAASGIKLTQGYANSAVCSATRTALITGRYQYRLRCGLEEPIGALPVGLPPEEPTLPSFLRRAGYRTSLVGKWHLGSLPGFGPIKSGYDHFFGLHEGGADYFSHKLSYEGVLRGGLFEGETPVERHGYMTDLLGDRAVEEIENAHREGKPLYLSLHFTAPHWPWEGPEDEAVSKTISHSMHWDGGNIATYRKMVERMDDNCGKVIAALKRLGQWENSIVVFTSDNGGERFSDTWPLTGVKTELLEGGIRVPIVMSWPARIKPGSVSEQVMVSMDFVPTLLAAAGVEADPAVSFDGENLLDVLTGAAPAHSRKLYWRYKAAEQAAVRDGEWKYLKIEGREYLFNLAEDERERANKKALNPDKFAALKADFEAWNAGMLPYPEDSSTHGMKVFLPDRY